MRISFVHPDSHKPSTFLTCKTYLIKIANGPYRTSSPATGYGSTGNSAGQLVVVPTRFTKFKVAENTGRRTNGKGGRTLALPLFCYWFRTSRFASIVITTGTLVPSGSVSD